MPVFYLGKTSTITAQVKDHEDRIRRIEDTYVTTQAQMQINIEWIKENVKETNSRLEAVAHQKVIDDAKRR